MADPVGASKVQAFLIFNTTTNFASSLILVALPQKFRGSHQPHRRLYSFYQKSHRRLRV